ncbi:hypothetical protein ACJX0J_003513 [Zea mays]
MNLIFFSIYRDRDIEFIGISIFFVKKRTNMLFTFHVLRMYPLEMGFINNFILKKRVGSRIYTAEFRIFDPRERLVMVLYALFYVFLGFMGTVLPLYLLDLWMKIQKRKWKPNSLKNDGFGLLEPSVYYIVSARKRRALRLKSIAYPPFKTIGRGTVLD